MIFVVLSYLSEEQDCVRCFNPVPRNFLFYITLICYAALLVL